MNALRIKFTAAALISAAGLAFADDITLDPYQHMVSTRTRAEVVAERDAAIRSGQIAVLHGEDSGSMAFARMAGTSQRTREQVRAEVLAARLDGTLDVLSGEDSGSFFLASLQRSGTPAGSVLMARVPR